MLKIGILDQRSENAANKPSTERIVEKETTCRTASKWRWERKYDNKQRMKIIWGKYETRKRERALQAMSLKNTSLLPNFWFVIISNPATQPADKPDKATAKTRIWDKNCQAITLLSPEIKIHSLRAKNCSQHIHFAAKKKLKKWKMEVQKERQNNTKFLGVDTSTS
jgi:hypothetical protein